MKLNNESDRYPYRSFAYADFWVVGDAIGMERVVDQLEATKTLEAVAENRFQSDQLVSLHGHDMLCVLVTTLDVGCTRIAIIFSEMDARKHHVRGQKSRHARRLDRPAALASPKPAVVCSRSSLIGPDSMDKPSLWLPLESSRQACVVRISTLVAVFHDKGPRRKLALAPPRPGFSRFGTSLSHSGDMLQGLPSTSRPIHAADHLRLSVAIPKHPRESVRDFSVPSLVG